MEIKIYRSYYQIFCVFLLTIAVLASYSPTHAKEIKIVAFGNSLTAGYQLSSKDSFPSKLQQKLRIMGYMVTFINAGVSGDTTADGLERVDWSVPEDADAVILELGANDALRGIDPEQTKMTLEKIVQRLKNKNLEILICGMLAPPNLGKVYADKFNPIFKDLADYYDTLFYPFFLEGVAAIPELNLDDGMHPNATGIDVIVERILPEVEKLIARVKG